MMDLAADIVKKIGMVLGRDLLAGEAGTVPSFAEFTDSDLADFRLLGSKSAVLAVSYIRYKLKNKSQLEEVLSYYASVVQQGISVDNWLNSKS